LVLYGALNDDALAPCFYGAVAIVCSMMLLFRWCS